MTTDDSYGSGRPEPRVHFEFGPRFLEAFVRAYGTQGWNRWMRRIIEEGYMPLGWSAGEDEPPVWYCMDFTECSLPQEILDRLDLSVCCMDADGDDGEPGRTEVRVPVKVVLVVD